jgi:dienelactone hydrolase
MAILVLPRPRTWSLALVRRRAGAVARGIGASADGLTVGLVLGYIAFTAVGAPASFLGIPDVAAIALVGSATAVIAAMGALAFIGIRGAVRALTRSAVARPAIAARPRLARLVGIPAATLGALPVGWLAAFGVFLWIVLVGRSAFAPLAILTPAGSTVPYLYLLGIVGAGLGLARVLAGSRGDDIPGPWRRRAGTALVLLSAGVVVGSASVAWWPGDAAGVATADAAYDGAIVPSPLADPGAPGPLAVERLSYGSGTDARRPEFGRDADLITTSVDGHRRLAPLDPGADAARAWFWGFETDELPIQGLAWLPVGDGPYPLVLIVHGNHAMGDFSESGYAYLGEHLASHGYVVASIDEDFLNGSWADDYLGTEQLVRAWLILLHLDTWRDWAGPDGTLTGRIDLDRVAVIGHSRGGEAASAAAALARSTNPAPNGLLPWPTGLDIDAVVSIAPSDGQYGSALQLDGVDFLTLQGGWDADARAWSGIRQYARTSPDPDGFAAGMWVYRANHGQFNTVWGATDFGPFSPAILDLAPLLSGEEQRDVARTAIGAFLAASLGDEDGYRGLFRRPMVGREWLPDDIVIVRSKEGTDRALSTAAPDRPIEGLTVTTAGAVARTMVVPLRALQPDQGLRGTLLTWDAGPGVASWSLQGLERSGVRATGSSALRISLADGRPVDADVTMASLPVVVAATSGSTTVRLPLDRFGALPPPLPVRLAKHDLLASTAGIDLSVRSASEVVLQTYAVPLAAFVEADPAFDPGGLTTLSVEIVRATDGALWIAEPALVP